MRTVSMRNLQIVLISIVTAMGLGACSSQETEILRQTDMAQSLIKANYKPLVAETEEQEYLVAYVDPVEAVLYVTDEPYLVESLAAGLWPALTREQGASNALFWLDEGEQVPLDVEKSDNKTLAAQEPKLNSVRFLQHSTPKKVAVEESIQACDKLSDGSGMHDADTGEPISNLDIYNESVKADEGKIPDHARSARDVRVFHVLLFDDDEGTAIAPEVFLATYRIYVYDRPDC